MEQERQRKLLRCGGNIFRTCWAGGETVDIISSSIIATPAAPDNGQAISQEDISSAISAFKGGLASCDHKWTEERFTFSPEILSVRLAEFFSLVLTYGHVPPIVAKSTSPIPKFSVSVGFDDFRSIAFSSPLYKILELHTLQKCSTSLQHSNLQFGFTEGHSTTNAVFIIKEAVAQARKAGGKLFCCFLDATKAFDCGRHKIFFQKLNNRSLVETFESSLWCE